MKDESEIYRAVTTFWRCHVELVKLVCRGWNGKIQWNSLRRGGKQNSGLLWWKCKILRAEGHACMDTTCRNTIQAENGRDPSYSAGPNKQRRFPLLRFSSWSIRRQMRLPKTLQNTPRPRHSGGRVYRSRVDRINLRCQVASMVKNHRRLQRRPRIGRRSKARNPRENNPLAPRCMFVVWNTRSMELFPASNAWVHGKYKSSTLYAVG